ncbi:MAG: hypothetical protein PVG14_05955 [Anaerolineales bacterium]|jgi:hypothetical protein
MSAPKSDPFEKAISRILDKQEGIYKNAWHVTDPDPEAEAAFAAWLDSRVRMAKKYRGITAFQLHLIPIAKRLEEHSVLDQRVFPSFTPKTYPQQREAIVEMFRQAKNLEEATNVACILVNLGDALQAALN